MVKDFKDLLKQTYFGNDVERWAVALGLALLVWAGLYIAKRLLESRLSRIAAHTKSHVDDVVVAILKATQGFFLLAAALYVGLRTLELPKDFTKPINILMLSLFFVQGGLWIQGAIRSSTLYWQIRRVESPGSRTMAGAINFLAQLVIWSLVFMMVLSNFGVEIGAIITGLGIGGIAAALAVQNVLGDLFASLALYFDTPFDIGDFIVTKGQKGTVEKIGLRSTRVRALSGEQLIFPNADLANNIIQNFKRMDERRVVFEVGVTYDTPYEALERMPRTIREIIEGVPATRFDRSHFREFGDSALIFETVYFCLTSDFNKYMDTQQAINLDLYQRFSEEHIDFAFPTRTLHIESAPKD
ncbi:MAG: mechanosensitive ion channel family protein [Myxococcales bacterium]|nr:mechanosensitive ion channel family protein [Myxococcales bacterium]